MKQSISQKGNIQNEKRETGGNLTTNSLNNAVLE